MSSKQIFILTCVCVVFYASCEKPKILTSDRTQATHNSTKAYTSKDKISKPKTANSSVSLRPIPFVPIIVIPQKPEPPKLIDPQKIQIWASEISDLLHKVEKHVVNRDLLLKGFTTGEFKAEERSGAAIIEKMAKDLEDLLLRRAKAAEDIMRKAEELTQDIKKIKPPSTYRFDHSYDLTELKQEAAVSPYEPYSLPLNCTQLRKLNCSSATHFDPQQGIAVNLDQSSVHTAAEVFACSERVIKHIYWSEKLLPTFKKNYEEDATIDFQYFCGASGFLRHYPAALWKSMFRQQTSDDDEEGPADVYDCRLRPWYVAAGGAPRDVLILLDASGSMNRSSNEVHAEQFTAALLNALTDDDQTNVLRFNREAKSAIPCFNDKLVSANHVNTAAMMSAARLYHLSNYTKMDVVLQTAIKLLQAQDDTLDRPKSCQQAIVLLTDSLYYNYSELMRKHDPGRKIRLIVIWLHDVYGLRDNTAELGEWVSCDSDGYYAELLSDFDVTEQVLRIMRVLERPLVAQRKQRLRVFSDVYAHVEDPRRAEFQWKKKENQEQKSRYLELRRNKTRLINDQNYFKDYQRHLSLDALGQYYEGQDVNYRFLITVSVPVFESTRSENITIKLFEEKQRSSTRMYPVNRLLGVAGVDMPIDRLKLIFPYHQLGPGGSLFLVDHRGNIVLHDNLKPTFDGDILKPGYRTVDFLDLEQSSKNHTPRVYPDPWFEFRKTLVIDQPRGNRTMSGKNIFEDGMRATMELREYHWRRVLDHYVAVVVLPKYGRRHAVPKGSFTQELAAAAANALNSEITIHPHWLYCRFVDPQYFNEREFELRHFISRRRDTPGFKMESTKHKYSPIFQTISEKTYQCNEELMVRLCHEAIASKQWAEEHRKQEFKDCTLCELGPITAFFAGESGLTRWQQYPTTTQHAEPPSGGLWPRGPDEPWYKRAAAASAPYNLVVHVPVAPIRKLRNSFTQPPPLGMRYKWLTAARTLSHPDKGNLGVTGYHFHPQHLEDYLKSVTMPCQPNSTCEAQCDGKEWTCLIVDDGGWIVAGHRRDEEDLTEDDPVTEHLARVYPRAMAALLGARVYELNWIHDYQAVCFPPEDETTDGATTMPSMLRTVWLSVNMLFCVSREIMTLLTVIAYGTITSAETYAEREKRRRRLSRDFQREKYETLYDDRVLINRTRFATCDRSRVIYELKPSRAIEALKLPTRLCSWPLVGSLIPGTNLLLLAVSNICEHNHRSVPDPLVNIAVKMSGPNDLKFSSASRLACWRNRVPLPTRPPPSASYCFPHNYTQEEGYRQCGPWLPNPEEDEESNASNFNEVNIIILNLFLLILYPEYLRVQ